MRAEVNAAMGLSIDKINEYEPILDGSREMAGQIVGGVSRRETRVRRNMKADPKEILHAGLEAGAGTHLATTPSSELETMRKEAS